ncbi:MAG: heavy metal-binding domain-containing protein [Thermomicrobiales bacterium]
MMCFNKKVIGGLAIVALGVLVVAPNLFLTALPLLLVAACPLSMLLMGRAMMGGGQRAAQNQQLASPGVAASYSCPMHPGVAAAGPGRCPECGMSLVPAVPATSSHAPPHADIPLDEAEQVAQLRAQLQRVTEEQAALARQVEQLEAAEAKVPAGRVVEEAERVAQRRAGRSSHAVERSRSVVVVDGARDGAADRAR